MNFTKYVFVMACFLSFVETNAQNDTENDRYKEAFKFKASLGINVIDDSFTKTHQLVGADEKWNVSLLPSFFGFNMLLTENISIESNFSYNKYQKGVLVNGVVSNEEKVYFAVDLNGKYDLSDLTWNSETFQFLKPYVFAGPGLTVLDEQSRVTINYGVGTIIWFSSFSASKNSDSLLNRLGVFLQTQGKSSVQQKKYGNQIQHSLGLVYRFN